VERGEESFLVEQRSDGRVFFTVKALSRPGHVLTKLGALVARMVQHKVTKRYLSSMRALVSNE
jgi:uncharacterized protein (UPF0548 family)